MSYAGESRFNEIDRVAAKSASRVQARLFMPLGDEKRWPGTAGRGEKETCAGQASVPCRACHHKRAACWRGSENACRRTTPLHHVVMRAYVCRAPRRPVGVGRVSSISRRCCRYGESAPAPSAFHDTAARHMRCCQREIRLICLQYVRARPEYAAP